MPGKSTFYARGEWILRQKWTYQAFVRPNRGQRRRHDVSTSYKPRPGRPLRHAPAGQVMACSQRLTPIPHLEQQGLQIPYNVTSWERGGIGRRSGLKIRLLRECGFESHRSYQMGRSDISPTRHIPSRPISRTLRLLIGHLFSLRRGQSEGLQHPHCPPKLDRLFYAFQLRNVIDADTRIMGQGKVCQVDFWCKGGYTKHESILAVNGRYQLTGDRSPSSESCRAYCYHDRLRRRAAAIWSKT